MMESVFRLERMAAVHLELTDKCNAACPMCGRNVQGGRERAFIRNTELRFAQVQRLLDEETVRRLRLIYLCGNFGDPAAARDVVEILTYFRRAHPAIALGMHSNGGLRSPRFWAALGRLIPAEPPPGGGGGYVRFGIDGLADTNHLYRRHVRWDRLMENVRAFVGAGGAAEWDYLVFRHNEHQVEEARALAASLGFRKFNVKTTGRFIDKQAMAPTDRLTVRDASGAPLYDIQPPDDPRWRHPVLEEFRLAGAVAERLDTCAIECQTVDRSLFISATGHVMPCCWLGAHVHAAWPDEFVAFIERHGGFDAIDGFRRPLADIVHGEMFAAIADGWDRSLADGRLRTCARTCGRGLQTFRRQRL